VVLPWALLPALAALVPALVGALVRPWCGPGAALVPDVKALVPGPGAALAALVPDVKGRKRAGLGAVPRPASAVALVEYRQVGKSGHFRAQGQVARALP